LTTRCDRVGVRPTIDFPLFDESFVDDVIEIETHLEEALQTDNLLEEDFHTQQVLRDSAVDGSQSEMETE